MVSRVILIRHGESSYNEQEIIQGCSDASVLTHKGAVSARHTGSVLKNIETSAIYTSDLRRAKETSVEILSTMFSDPSNLPTIEALSFLREIDLADWAGLPRSTVKERFQDDYYFWRCQPHLFQTQGNRFPVLEIFERAKTFWKDIAIQHSDSNILLVAHSGTNKALISTALDIPPSKYHSLEQSNCGISILKYDNSLSQNVQLEFFNLTHHLGEPIPSLKKDKQYLRLIIVRHTETDWNQQRRFQGQLDIPLNEVGINHAMQVAETLRNTHIDFAISSSLKRPTQTAELILKHHPHVNLERMDNLIEMSYGVWQGKTEIEVEKAYPGELEHWRKSPMTLQIRDAENLQQVWQRVTLVWDSLVENMKRNTSENQTCLVVSHDVTNRIILCHILGLSYENFWSLKQVNGGISVIDYPLDESPPVLRAMNIPTEDIRSFISSKVDWNV